LMLLLKLTSTRANPGTFQVIYSLFPKFTAFC
jgi:hypothetical protein